MCIRDSLGVMEADTLRMRGKRPFVFSNLKSGEGVEPIARFIIEKGGLAKNAANQKGLHGSTVETANTTPTLDNRLQAKSVTKLSGPGFWLTTA